MRSIFISGSSNARTIRPLAWRALFVAALLTVVGACGGGSGGGLSFPPPPPAPPPPENISSLGVITAFSSATVNGVLYDTPQTLVSINGQPGTMSDLKLGQLVAIDGTIDFTNITGVASAIDYNATCIGPIESVDAASRQLVVMGQTVLIDDDTILDASIDPTTLTGLTTGENAQISGFPNAAGDIVATRVDPDTTSTNFFVFGAASDIDLANQLFSMNRLIVDYSGATVIDLPGGAPTDGLWVGARGSLTNGILVADAVESVYDSGGGTVGERVHGSGVVTRFGGSADFDLNGFPVVTDSSTTYAGGTAADLETNAQIRIDGHIDASGQRILADLVSFTDLVADTDTTTFNFSDFTEVTVASFFRATITQGDFAVQVTIDDAFAGNVVVTKTGNELSVDLDNLPNNVTIHTIEAAISLPILERVRLNDISGATVSGFTQQSLAADVTGISQLSGEALMIGNLTAVVSGVSQLDFADVSPLGSASVDVSGVSNATVNMDDSSTLSGSVSGVSNLFYYGTNVTANVTVDATSNLIRLGDTRP